MKTMCPFCNIEHEAIEALGITVIGCPMVGDGYFGLMFEKYAPAPVVHGPLPADGHQFWQDLRIDYESIRQRARVLAARYAAACAEQPWADRLREAERNAGPRPATDKR